MNTIDLSRQGVFAAAFAAVLSGLSAGAAAQAEGQGRLEFEVDPLEPRRVECAFEAAGEIVSAAPVFDLMKTGPGQAVACAEFLDEKLPGWHGAAGADELVAPFVSYLLGDGSARGLQRHQIFVDLLGHLEAIAPDWRLRDSVEALLPQIILGSVVEDPFVANFWSVALPEIDQRWPESGAARSVVPELYRRAVLEAQESGGTPNDRPKMALKEISWSSYSRFQLATRVFDTWPKRLAVISAALIPVLAVVALRRRKRA